MQLSKIINEAVYHALADIDDEDIVLTKSNIDFSKSEKKYKELKFIDDSFADLDLPSGTKWCKFNVGSTCEDDKESWYGNFYEYDYIEPTKQPDHLTYAKLLKSETNFKELMAYNCIPSEENFKELIDNTEKEWITQYNGIDGLNGWKLYSRKDSSKYIFMPACGKNHNQYAEDGIFGYYWSATMSPIYNYEIQCLYISCRATSVNCIDSTYNKFAVRPIFKQ